MCGYDHQDTRSGRYTVNLSGRSDPLGISNLREQETKELWPHSLPPLACANIQIPNLNFWSRNFTDFSILTSAIIRVILFGYDRLPDNGMNTFFVILCCTDRFLEVKILHQSI